MKRARLLSPAERWVLPVLLLASVAGHALAFVVFAVTDRVAVANAAQPTRVAALVAPGAERTVRYALVATLDPSLIALPSARGFSGKPWARPMGVSHQPYKWDVPPSYLEPPPTAGWAGLLPLRSAAETVRAAARQLTARRDEEPLPERPRSSTADRSMLRLAGALAQRALLLPPPLGKVVSGTALRPTVLRLGVEPAGTVRFANLERGCGNESVDAQALQWARQARFEPLGVAVNGALEWGVATFYWATEPPPAVAPVGAGAGTGTAP